MSGPVRTSSLSLTPWQQFRKSVRGVVHRLLVLYAVVGVLGSVASLFISGGPAFEDPAPSASAGFDPDVANSWNRFNAEDVAVEPSWTVGDVESAGEGARGGDVVTLRGTQSVLDTARVRTAIAGTRYLVVLTPPTPLGASEATRLRDNSVQQFWADQHGVVVVMVHGQQVVLPYGKLSPTIIFDIPSAGLPQREAYRTGDVTDTALSVIASARKEGGGGDEDPGTLDAASVALTNTRAPTAGELAPVTKALDAGPLYVDPSITDPPAYDRAWSTISVGTAPKIVLLPFARSGTAVDWTSALAARYPHTAILVMTGKWIESADVDRDQVLAAMWQTYAVGEFALASSPPAYEPILDWVTSVAGIARAAAAQHTALPAAAPGGIPRWLSYLVLGTSLLIAAAFAVPPLLQRRRRRRSVSTTGPGDQHDALVSTLSDCYLQVGRAADLAIDDAVRTRTCSALDVADANLQALRSMPRDPIAVDDRRQQQAAARAAWFALDEAARIVGRPDLRPDTLSPGLQPRPAAPGSLPPAPRRSRRSVKLTIGWPLVVVVVLALAFLFSVGSTLVGLLGRSTGLTGESPATLRTSNTAGLDGPERAGAEQAIADRALMLVHSQGDFMTAGRTGDAVAAAYPDAIVFVLRDGKVDDVEIGRDAAVPGYDVYSLIKDYYPVQTAAGTDPVPQARQLVLLYDRLAAEGSIRGAIRARFDGPPRPWPLIIIVVVLTLVAAALIIRFGAGAASRRLTSETDLQAQREALSLRLAGAQENWIEHDNPGSRAAEWARRARDLQSRIATSDTGDIPGLARQIDELHAELSRR